MGFLSTNEAKWKRGRVLIIYFRQMSNQIRYGLVDWGEETPAINLNKDIIARSISAIFMILFLQIGIFFWRNKL